MNLELPKVRRPRPTGRVREQHREDSADQPMGFQSAARFEPRYHADPADRHNDPQSTLEGCIDTELPAMPLHLQDVT
jgi:hypothetical protein